MALEVKFQSTPNKVDHKLGGSKFLYPHISNRSYTLDHIITLQAVMVLSSCLAGGRKLTPVPSELLKAGLFMSNLTVVHSLLLRNAILSGKAFYTYFLGHFLFLTKLLRWVGRG